MRSVLAVVLVLASLHPDMARADDGGAASAMSEPPADAAAAEEAIGLLDDEGRVGEALVACERDLARFADAGRLHLVCGLVYQSVYRLDDAERHLLRASELLPKSAEPLADLAWLESSRGNDARARTLAERALALDADADAARAVLAELDQRDALRKAPPPEPPAGSPAHAVWSFVERARKGQLVDAMVAHLDVVSIVAVLREAGVSIERADEDFLRGFSKGVARTGFDAYSAFHGYAFVDTPEPTGDTAFVTVRVYAERRPDVGRAALIGRALDNRVGATMLPPALVAVYRGLPAEERLPFLRRLSNVPEPLVADLRFDLRRRGGAWKIADVGTIGDEGGEVSLSRTLREHRAAAEIQGRSGASSSERLAHGVGVVVGSLAMMGLVIGLLWRAARRRRTT